MNVFRHLLFLCSVTLSCSSETESAVTVAVDHIGCSLSRQVNVTHSMPIAAEFCLGETCERRTLDAFTLVVPPSRPDVDPSGIPLPESGDPVPYRADCSRGMWDDSVAFNLCGRPDVADATEGPAHVCGELRFPVSAMDSLLPEEQLLSLRVFSPDGELLEETSTVVLPGECGVSKDDTRSVGAGAVHACF